jgi:hypothetical protein
MKKYIFIAPHTIGTEQVINKQGVLLSPATTIKVFKIGDIIEGKVHTYPTMGGIDTRNLPKFIDTIINGKSYLIPPKLIKDYTEASLSTTNNTTNGNDSKKTITIVLVLVALLGLLKWKKII